MQSAIWNWNACGITREVAFMNYIDNKTSSINPPPLTPHGTKCFPVKCLYGSICCCYKRIIGQCKDFSCCAPSNPVCYKVNRSCCALATPNCDAGKSRCYKVLVVPHSCLPFIYIFIYFFFFLQGMSIFINLILWCIIWLQKSGNATLAIQSEMGGLSAVLGD